MHACVYDTSFAFRICLLSFLVLFSFFASLRVYFFRSLFVCLRELFFWKRNVQYTGTHTLFGVFSCDNESYCVIAVDRYPDRDERVAG